MILLILSVLSRLPHIWRTEVVIERMLMFGFFSLLHFLAGAAPADRRLEVSLEYRVVGHSERENLSECKNIKGGLGLGAF